MRLDLKEDAYERQDASTAYNVSTANSNDSLEFVKKRTRERGEEDKPPRALTSFFAAAAGCKEVLLDWSG